MADPVITAIPISIWTKVATNVTRGAVLPLLNVKGYVQTYRDTGGAAPPNGDTSEGKAIPWEGVIVSNAAAIDVYVAMTGSVAGSVRVDL